MRKGFALLICILFVMSFSIIGAATETTDDEQMLLHSQQTLACGITLTREITILNSQSRASTKTYIDKNTYSQNGETIAEIWITGTFQYNGNTVSVVSKSISKCETYDGWSFKQSSFTSSGGTISLSGKLTKLLIFNANVNISLSCDKNGNIS